MMTLTRVSHCQNHRQIRCMLSPKTLTYGDVTVELQELIM